MAEMPRVTLSRRQRIVDGVLGIVHETLWILFVSAIALGMAALAVAVYR